MKNIKKGFTLAEMMIVLVLLGVISVLALTSIQNMTPKKEKLMFKKAYKTAESVVSELINNQEIYASSDEGYALQDTNAVMVEGVSYGATKYTNDTICTYKDRTKNGEISEQNITGATEAAPKYVDAECNVISDGVTKQKSKFRDLFKSKINITEESGDTFMTSDGTKWVIKNYDFKTATTYASKYSNKGIQCKKGIDGYCYVLQIQIKVNQKNLTTDEEPNCHGGQANNLTEVSGLTYGAGIDQCNSRQKANVFYIYVDNTGKMWVEGTLEKEYLQDITQTK